MSLILKQIKENEQYFNSVNFEGIKKGNNKKGILKGFYISVKDSICVNGLEVRAGSKVLEGYKPPFDSTTVKRIKEEGGVIIGTTSMDEFGFGSFNKNVGLGFKIPKNPVDNQRVTGGSSGGGAALTKKLDNNHVSLCESTGGSIVNPAGFCGVVGYCPSYGVISRYGLITYSDSLDKMGIFSKKVFEAKKVFEIIKGFDDKDLTTTKKDLIKVIKKPKLGFIKSFLNFCDKEVKNIFLKYLEKLEKKGFEIVEIKLPVVEKFSVPCYYVLAFSEASTNLARYNGLKYGTQDLRKGEHFENYFTRLRTNNFGKEVKRRILLGTFTRMSGYRDQYYSKANKVRRLIVDEYEKTFNKIDLLINPTNLSIAPKLIEADKFSPSQEYVSDLMVVGPNIAGLPHATIPMKKEGMPVGFMITGSYLNDLSVFNFMKEVEDL